MTDELQIDESLKKWIHAFYRWYHSKNRDWIIANLREGVPLSPENSRFLAAILDDTVRPLSGKQTTQAQVKKSIIDVTIDNLRREEVSREGILHALKERGLVKTRYFSISALNKRIDGLYRDPAELRMELDKKFAALYETITKM